MIAGYAASRDAALGEHDLDRVAAARREDAVHPRADEERADDAALADRAARDRRRAGRSPTRVRGRAGARATATAPRRGTADRSARGSRRSCRSLRRRGRSDRPGRSLPAPCCKAKPVGRRPEPLVRSRPDAAGGGDRGSPISRGAHRARISPRRRSAPTCSPTTGSCSGPTRGTRAPTSSPTASSTRRWGPSSARAWSARSRWSRQRPCSHYWSGAASRGPGAGGDAVVRGRGVGMAADRADAVPARGAVRARGAARGRFRPRCAGRVRGRAREPLEPGRRAVHRLAGVAIALAGERLRGAALAIGGALPIAVLNLAFPLGGEEPFVFSAFIAIPILAAGVVWLVPREYRALRIGAVLYARARDRAVRRPELAGRQRHPARDTVRRAGGGARALAARAAGGDRGLGAVALLAVRRAGARRAQGRRAIRRPSRPSTSRCWPSSTARRRPRARSESRSRRRRTAGRPPTWPATTRSPAGGCDSSSPRTSTCSPGGNLTAGGLPRLAARPRGQLRGGARRPPRLPLRGRGGADRHRAWTTCDPCGATPTGASTGSRRSDAWGSTASASGTWRPTPSSSTPRRRRRDLDQAGRRSGASRAGSGLRARGRGRRDGGRAAAGSGPITVQAELGGDSCSG